jgi:hypothetical protein
MKSSITSSAINWINGKNYKIGYGDRKYSSTVLLIIVFLFPLQINIHSQEFFNYQKYLFDPLSSLSVNIESIDINSGYVKINGVDLGNISAPFDWDWGDGTIESGWFPMEHTYFDVSQNYILRVTAHYLGGGEEEAEAVVHFVPPTILPIPLSEVIPVYIPDNDDVLSTLGTRLYQPPTGLTYFDNSFFTAVPRSTLEYVLTAAAQIQKNFVNDDMFLFNEKFEQYMFRDPTFGGAYSLWFTDPVTFGVGDPFMLGNIDFSSLFHEMGHNFTLNTPANFYYGDIIGGNANAIYSESMAQIFQHATGYEIVNNYDYYGFSEDLMMEIKQQVIRTIKFVRYEYELYIFNGKPFASWNDPSTQEDETMTTFMTIAYKFCEHAENAGEGYMIPLKRMMTLLQELCPEWANSYDHLNNNIAADEFRATLMVKALSEAFQTDLREEFRDLNFPVSDQIYNALPVELVSFTATAIMSNSIRLDWYTATEINNYGFEVERKSSNNWQKIGFVQGHGNSNSPKQYSFTDNKLIGGSKFQYRLKQTDNDGQFEYSNIIEVKVIPKEYLLSQNYPNPFNSSSIIKYSIPKSSQVSLKIFNTLGEELETLVNEERPVGSYEVNWNAGNLPSGVYFYSLQAGDFVQARKMILLK